MHLICDGNIINQKRKTQSPGYPRPSSNEVLIWDVWNVYAYADIMYIQGTYISLTAVCMINRLSVITPKLVCNYCRQIDTFCIVVSEHSQHRRARNNYVHLVPCSHAAICVFFSTCARFINVIYMLTHTMQQYTKNMFLNRDTFD